MGLRIDLHVHTRLYSPCSIIDPDMVVKQAIRAGLDGLVLTEHYRQWTPGELQGLLQRVGEPNFLLLAGFEYGSNQGDILIYGLPDKEANNFPRGLAPGDAVKRAHALGGICVAAHPTRAGMGFDERIFNIPFNAIEVKSVNLKEHEQRLALQLAKNLDLSPVASSDAHQVRDIGRYATEFEYPIQSITDLLEAFKRGTFRPAPERG